MINRMFRFYRETGVRLKEPMMSVLDGAWIDIPNTSKTKKGRNIELDKPFQTIFIELKDWCESGYGSTLVDKGADHISKKFKKALRSIGADERKHFHSLRHTFAVRRVRQGMRHGQFKFRLPNRSIRRIAGFKKGFLHGDEKLISTDEKGSTTYMLTKWKKGKKGKTTGPFPFP
jgi:hypothetical protein